VRALLWWLQHQSTTTVAAIVLVLTFAVALADTLSGPFYSFLVFNLLPIGLAAWRLGARTGYLIAALCTGLWVVGLVIDPRPALAPLVLGWNLALRMVLFAFVVWLIRTACAALERAEHAARTDPLTGLHNRRHFYELVAVEMERARRSGHPFTLAYLDLDDFKALNDQFGHQTGDTVLVAVAAALHTHLRASDQCARLGGDEFAVLLPETDSAAGHQVCERLHAAITEVMSGRGWAASCSMGVVTYAHIPASIDDTIALADQQLYRAKGQGKAQTVYHVAESPGAQSQPAEAYGAADRTSCRR